MSTFPGVPTLHVITRAFRKTPVPMTFPMMIDTAATSPSPRTSVMFFSALLIRVIAR